MALKKKPVNGMKDILPNEARIRDYVTGVIKNTYTAFGFSPIETPVMEDIDNLLGSKGGENEKLIFKVLKRGEKLNIPDATTEEEVVDFGMRYDLTVPLCRYYSCHENELVAPFKALQIGNVWRADRPQKGRYRQFTQCDIDIIGEPSNLAEKELILATGACIGRLGFSDFNIRINDRGILRSMVEASGFPLDKCDEVFITLDKMDKIGIEGVESELLEMGFSKDSVSKYLGLFKDIEEIFDFKEKINKLKEELTNFGVECHKYFDNVLEIAETVNAAKECDFNLIFDPTLVRGMGYYTGTIFEIEMPELSISCGGGGRYDNLVGAFLGKDVPACGFSIGFERIILLLLEKGYEVPGEDKKIAYLVEKGYPKEKLSDVFSEAAKLRKSGSTVLVTGMNKNKKFQKEQLEKEGYKEFKEFFNN